jgi:hypothetical protein
LGSSSKYLNATGSVKTNLWCVGALAVVGSCVLAVVTEREEPDGCVMAGKRADGTWLLTILVLDVLEGRVLLDIVRPVLCP